MAMLMVSFVLFVCGVVCESGKWEVGSEKRSRGPSTCNDVIGD